MVSRFLGTVHRSVAPIVLASAAGAASLQEAVLTSPDPEEFGHDVDLDGDTAVVGDPLGTVGLDDPVAMAFQPGTNVLFVAENYRLMTLDPATLEEELVGYITGGNPDNVQALAFDPISQALFGATEKSPSSMLLVIDPATGAGQEVGPIGFLGVRGLAFHPLTNILYGCDHLTDKLITIDPVTGKGTTVGLIGFSNVRELAIVSSGVLYGADNGETLIRIDPSTGLGTAVGPLGFTQVEALAFDPIGQAFYGCDLATHGFLSIDPITGVGSSLGSYPHYQEPGLAWVFQRHPGGSWTREARLLASDWQDTAQFGTAVAIAGDTIAVGAHQDGFGDPGAVYIFERDLGGSGAWGERVKVLAQSPLNGKENFGRSVALSGDTLLVSGEWDPGIFTGLVAFHERDEGGPNAWGETHFLVGQVNDRLGEEGVDLDQDVAVLSAFGNDKAYVLERDAVDPGLWNQVAELLPPEGQQGVLFGPVAVWADTVLVGAQGWDSGYDNSGAAFVFERDSQGAWEETALLSPLDPVSNGHFGCDVGVHGNTALVGARGGGFVDGAAYVFERFPQGWRERAKLDIGDEDTLGEAVSLSQGVALVGQVSVYGQAVYSFPAIFPTTYCTSGTSASGCQAALSASGAASSAAPSGFDLEAAAVEGSKDGLFFFGTSGRQANSWGNGTSYQCVVPPLVRTPIMTGIGTIGLCDGSFALDLNALWCPSCPKPQKNPGSGSLVQAQLWYRDPFSTSNQTTSLSDAIEFVVLP